MKYASLILALFLAACQPAPPSAAPSASGPIAPQIPTVDDSCATRMHEIEESLLLYVASRRELPPTLDGLLSLAGQKLELTCPVSGKPYVYHPNGLVTTNDPRVLVLYDSTPIHAGKRQAILLTPAKAGRAPIMDVVLITDEILKAFHAAPTFPAP